jgi:hypothetical protein
LKRRDIGGRDSGGRDSAQLALLLTLAIGACTAAPVVPPPPLAEVLELAAVQSPWPAGQSLILEGPARISGATGSFRLELQGPRSYRLELRGPLLRVSADDGEQAWTQEGSGPARGLVLLERDKLALLMQAISGGWNSPGAPHELMVMNAARDEVNLAIDFPGEAPALGLSIDLESGDVSEIASMNRGRVSRWSLTDWRELGGRRLPGTVEFKGNRQAGSRLEIQSAHWKPSLAERLQRPKDDRDSRFEPGASDVVQGRRNESGHVFVPVTFGNRDPHWFLLDTGASGIVIDDDLARELDLKPVGVVGAVGGTGRTFSQLSQAPDLRVGPLTIERPTVMTLDLGGFAAYLEGGVTGVLGWEFFARAAVRFPAAGAEPSVVIRPPGGFDGDGLDWNPVLASDAVAVVRGSVDDKQEGWFLLDTGAAWTAAIHTPWLAPLELPGERETTPGQARGIVSLGRTLVVCLESLNFADQTIVKPIVHLAIVDAGSLADRSLMGNIGLEALAPFEVTFDLGNEKLALRKLP